MAKAKRVHSTPRRTASKIQTKRHAKAKRPTLVELGDRGRASALARAQQIVELLSTCYVRESWKIDRAAAKRALAYVREYAEDGSDPDDGREVAMEVFHSHGQSLDWIFCGDVGGMICGLAKLSERANDVAGPVKVQS